MDKQQGANLFGGFPEQQKLRLIKGTAIDVIIDHGAFETQLDHGPFQFSNGGLDVLYRQGNQASEALGVVDRHLMHLVIADSSNRSGGGGILVVFVESDIGGDDLDIDPQRVHIGQPLFRRPGVHRDIPLTCTPSCCRSKRQSAQAIRCLGMATAA
jgi:hypothetical protein